MIRFRCPGCKRVLSVKDEMAGKRAGCVHCKKVFVVPRPKAASAGAQTPSGSPKIRPPRKKPPQQPPKAVEKLAADLLADAEAKERAAKAPAKVSMTCPYCDEEVQFDTELAGKQAPCPECRRIIRVDKPKDQKPSHWREASQTGPRFAKENVGQKIEDAWGTETDRKGVHRVSLEEAGVIDDSPRIPPGRLWFRRGVAAVVVLALIAGGYFAATSYQSQTSWQAALGQAAQVFETVKDQMPRSWQAEYHRLRGEAYLKDDLPDDARKSFYAARFVFPEPGAKNQAGLDEEILLALLAVSQVGLGGSEEQYIAETRLRWESVLDDLRRTISAIPTDEGKVFTMRQVFLRLRDAKQMNIALSLAGQCRAEFDTGKENSPFTGMQVAMLLAMQADQQARELLPFDGKTARIGNLSARLGYAEGAAYRGEFQKAIQVAMAPGIAPHRVAALAGVGTIAAASGDTEAAGKCVTEALKIIEKSRVPPTTLYEVCRLAAAIGMADEANGVLGRIPNSRLRALARFEILKAKASSDPASFDLTAVSAKDAVAYALAVEFIVRHGNGEPPTDVAAEVEPIVHLCQGLRLRR